MSRGDDARFWGHAAAFGAMWGALEATVGTFLHAMKIPFGGTMLAGMGAAFLVALRVLYPRRGVLLATGAVCAGVKLLSPATTVAGPMMGILMESLLVELACLPAGAVLPAALVGGALATLWALSQKVLVQIADSNEARTGRQIDLAVRLLEPVMLMVMAVVVLLIAMALLVPILRMSAANSG